MSKIIGALTVMLLLAACQTKYAEYDGASGVSAYAMGNDLYRITARGNQFTDEMLVMDFILLKAAETTLNAGYDTFAVIGTADNTARSTTVGPGVVSTAMIGGVPTSFVVPPQSHTSVAPGAHVMIKVGNLKEGETLRPMMFNARQTYDAISKRVERG